MLEERGGAVAAASPQRDGTAVAAPGEAGAPWLERWGLDYFRKLSAKKRAAGAPAPAPGGALDDDEIHVLDAGERSALRRIERGAIIRAGVAGALSALVAVLAELYAETLLPAGETSPSLGEHAAYWGLILAVSGVATVFEIGFLYWDGLRSVYSLSAAAGLDLGAVERPEHGTGPATALARAALELPNPPERLFDVDPRREASRFKLLAITIAYKLKISVTNFVVKTVFRRIFGRTALRAWAPFMAVPVTAGWNAAITWFILRQARLRTMGPSAACEHIDAVLDAAPELSEAGRLAALRAVGSAIVRTHDMHPNLAAMMRRLRKRLGDPGDAIVDDSGLFLAELATLPAAEQDVALRVLTLSAIIDGRVTGPERTLLRQAHEAAGRTLDESELRRVRRAFAAGREFTLA